MILKPNEAMMTEATDTQILDFLADERIFDGINGLDIDEMTSDALKDRGITCGSEADTEEAWQLEWRRQFRIAIMRGMARNAPKLTVLPVIPATGHPITQDEIDAATGGL